MKLLTVAFLVFATLPTSNGQVPSLAEAGPAGSCLQDEDSIHCTNSWSPAGMTIDGFADLVEPPCASEASTLDELHGYSGFVEAAREQYQTDFAQEMRVVGTAANCENSCGCLGCFGTTVFGYFVLVCGGCLACCEADETASCSCSSPQIWQVRCSCESAADTLHGPALGPDSGPAVEAFDPLPMALPSVLA